MPDIVVKGERFIGAFHNVELVTIEQTSLNVRYFSIIKDGTPVYVSKGFYGGSREDVIRNCDTALEVVRVLLTETGFLTGEVVGT